MSTPHSSLASRRRPQTNRRNRLDGGWIGGASYLTVLLKIVNDGTVLKRAAIGLSSAPC